MMENVIAFTMTCICKEYNYSVFKTGERKCLFTLFEGNIIQGIIRCKYLPSTPV